VDILVAETFPEPALKALETLGPKVRYAPKVTAEGLAQALQGASILVVRGRTVDGPTLRTARDLSLLVRAGAGINAIDVATASRLGIYVANTPGKNAIAVAELVFGLLLAIDREIPASTDELHRGVWAKGSHGGAWGLHGRTLGIVGLGATGQEVALRARAFGLKLIGWSRNPDRGRELGVARVSLPELFAEADAVSLHLALTPETKGLIDETLLRAMKPSAILLNAARAELVQEMPLQKIVTEGRIRLGTDVFHHEPEGSAGTLNDAIGRLPTTVGTHHLGASTAQAQDAVADEVVRIVRRFLEAGEVPNCVNLARRTPARCQLVVRHRDRVGVLASVLAALRSEAINAQEIHNEIFEGAEAASCRIQLDTIPSEALLGKLRGEEDIYSADLVSL
jgi:D-3-phosphoglycerate dehydrogenase